MGAQAIFSASKIPASSPTSFAFQSLLAASVCRWPSLLIKPEYDQWSPGEHTGTFRGNNLAFVSATVAIDYWKDQEFLAALASSQARIRAWISEIVAVVGPANARAKGRGLMCGIEFSQGGLAEQIAAEAFQRKVLIETCGPNSEVLKLFPPLTIEADLLEEGLTRLRDAITTVFRHDGMQSAA